MIRIFLLVAMALACGCCHSSTTPRTDQYWAKRIGDIYKNGDVAGTSLYTVEIEGRTFYATNSYSGYLQIGPEVKAERKP